VTPERYGELEDLWHRALEKPAAERQAFVDTVCASDEALRRELESLLASFEQAEGFLEQPPDDVAAEMFQVREEAEVTRTLAHYVLRSRLGAGGMGEIFLAEDIHLGRQVALKLLTRESASEGDRKRRLLLEAQAASTLNHPNVAQIYEIAEAEGIEFIAMEYVPGRTLSAHLQERQLRPAEVVEIAVQVADALEEAHARGVIHRDIKPSNIMITPRGRAKVLDFGIAKITAAARQPVAGDSSSALNTEPGAFMGTPEYMSPEQALGLDVDFRSDIFSFGSMLYEMAAGRRPFGGRTSNETLDAVIHAEPETIAALNPAVPSELVRVVAKCLPKDRERRYPSAKELHADLRNLASPRFEALLRVRLAVLPFESIGAGRERDYLADALTEETISALGQLEPDRLSVIGRTSVMAYQHTRKTLVEIGRELDAAYLVESSIRSEGNRVRVMPKLTRAADQVQIWSASYDAEPASMLAFQRELGMTIAEQIRLRLSPQRLETLSRRQTRNPQAYDLYLRGRHFWNQLTPTTTRQAIELFSRATDLDADYALAWSGLADAYSASPVTGDAPAQQVWVPARKAALEAVRADPELAESQSSLGFVDFWLDWKWGEAERAFRKAIASDPSYAFAHRMLGHVLSNLGRHPEARQEMQRARELDPLYAMHHALSAQVAFAARDYQAAIQFARQGIVIDPEFWIGHFQLAQALEQTGQIALALVAAKDAGRFSGGNSKAISLRGYIYAKQGSQEEARNVLKGLEGVSHEHFVPPYAMALVHAGLGEHEVALDWLERGFQLRDVHLVFLPIDPKWDAFRADRRFRDLLRRCDLPGAEQTAPLR